MLFSLILLILKIDIQVKSSALRCLLCFKFGAFKLHESYLMSVVSSNHQHDQSLLVLEYEYVEMQKRAMGNGEIIPLFWNFGFCWPLIVIIRPTLRYIYGAFVVILKLDRQNQFSSTLIKWERAAITFFRLYSFIVL